MSKRLLYVLLVPSPRRDRRLNRLNVLSPRPSPGGTVANYWLTSRPPLSQFCA